MKTVKKIKQVLEYIFWLLVHILEFAYYVQDNKK